MGTGQSILIVDDDDDVRNMLCAVLATEGYEASGACDGVEALENMRGSVPALLLVDLMMPRMDGATLLHQMKQDPRLACIPVALMSGHSHAAALHDMPPVDVFLVKPLELDELLSVVARLVTVAG